MANAVQELSSRTPGKESMAIESFARALRQLPTIIADNAGYDSSELISQLKALHSEGKSTMGLGECELEGEKERRGGGKKGRGREYMYMRVREIRHRRYSWKKSYMNSIHFSTWRKNMSHGSLIPDREKPVKTNAVISFEATALKMPSHVHASYNCVFTPRPTVVGSVHVRV